MAAPKIIPPGPWLGNWWLPASGTHPQLTPEPETREGRGWAQTRVPGSQETEQKLAADADWEPFKGVTSGSLCRNPGKW